MGQTTQQKPRAFDGLLEQPRVKTQLEAAVSGGRIGHAYLFVGPPGSGKLDAAMALAKCIICPQGGDDSCDECRRVGRKTHPDVRWLAPESVKGYLVEQVRTLISDAALSPVRAKSKVYVLDRADLLRDASANALLKTLEEPPQGVHFILCGRSISAVMPTIASRCQVVPFRVVPVAQGLEALKQRVVCTDDEARMALAITGSPSRGAEFLGSAARLATRARVVRAFSELSVSDDWDLLTSARDICSSVSDQLDDMRVAQEAALGENADFLSSQAMKALEEANKRTLTAQQRAGMMEVLAEVKSLLRDVMICCEHLHEPLVNTDAQAAIKALAASVNSQAILDALLCVRHAEDDLTSNVSPQLAMETMLLRIKEATLA